MAASTSLIPGLERISKNHLQCSICQEEYHQPKILTCLHSFCQTCLEKYRSKQYRLAQKIPCPLCQQETVLPEMGVSGLKTNFHINSLMDDVTLQQEVAKSALKCDICHPKQAGTHRCLDCAKTFCTNCRSTHKKFPDLSDHAVVTLKDLRMGKVSLRKRKCKDRPECNKHPGEVKHFFCEKCEELICRDCTVVDHPASTGHSYTNLNTALVKRRQSLTESISVLDQNKKKLKQSLRGIPEMKQALKRNVTESIQQVQSSAQMMRKKVTAQETRLIGQINNSEKDRMGKFDACKNELDSLLLRNEHSTEVAQDIADTASDTDFLSLYPEIKRDLNTLRNVVPPGADKGQSFVRFQPTQMVGEINLGRLDQGYSLNTGFDFGASTTTSKIDFLNPNSPSLFTRILP